MQTGFVDFETAQEFLGHCSRATIYRRVASGQITLYKLGSKSLLKIEELNALPVRQGPDPAVNDNDEPAAA